MRKLGVQEMGRLQPEAFKKAEKIPVVVVVDRVRSLLNVGSIFRTADAFRIEKVILCGITAQPPHREINKTALGATESVDWTYYDDTNEAVDQLISKGYHLIALEQAENSIQPEDLSSLNFEKYAIVLGHEVNGVDQTILDKCQHALEIPQLGTKHSLNVSVAAGIAMWEMFKLFDIK